MAAGQIPLFEQREVAGIPSFVLPLALGTELAYAVSGDRVVVSTGTDAIARIRRAGPGLLAAAEAAGRVNVPSRRAETVVFTQPGQLLALGDLLGVTADPAVQAVRNDLARVRAFSIVAQREETDTTAELLFQIP